MIIYNYKTNFLLEDENATSEWILSCLEGDFKIGELNYIFCDDNYLHKLNLQFLQHDTLTDIISFDYTLGNIISGDVFISIDRVKENAKDFNVSFYNELHRVIIHGVLHYMGYKDKTEEDKKTMRSKENACLSKKI